MFADLAAGNLPASHQALDAHPRRRAVDFLRQMLTAGGALPPRDEELARTGQWLTGVLDTVEPDPAPRTKFPFPSRSASSSPSSSATAAATPGTGHQPSPVAVSRRAAPASRSQPTGSAADCEHSAYTPSQAAAPPSPI